MSAALLLAANLVTALLAIDATGGTKATALWWPSAGLGALTLILLPRSWWTWLIPAVTGTYFLASVLGGRPLGAAAALAVVGGLSTTLVAWAVYRLIGRRLETVTDFLCFLGIALAGASLAAVGVASIAVWALDGEFAETLAVTLAAHLAAIVLIVPIGMLPSDRVRGPRWALVAQVVLLLTSSAFAFGPNQELRLGFVPLLFLIWAAIAFGCRVIMVELLMLAVLITTANVRGWGPFDAPEQGGSQVAHLYLVSLAIAGMTLALAIRENRLSAEAKGAERRRTEAIVESTSMLVIVTDEEGRMLSANPALTALAGYPLDSMTGRPYWEPLLPAEAWPAARAKFAESPPRGSTVIRTSAGDERIITYTRNRLVDPVTGEVNYVITGTDITAERETSAFLQHLLRSANTVAIVGTDLVGEITLVNAAAENLLGISGAPGQRLTDYLGTTEGAEGGTDHGGVTGFSALIAGVTLDSDSETVDRTWATPGRPPLRVSITSSLVCDARRRPIGYLFVTRDVTDTRRNQELLHQALERERAAVGHLRALDHAKDDFISTVSHELRTPLTSIIGSIELLEDGTLGDLDAEQKHLTDVIERNAERLLALANNLLLLAAHEGAAAEPLLVKLDLREVVIASEASVLPLLNHRDLRLRVDQPDLPVQVLGDADYLERAVTNLLTNAIKFTPDGGTITTSVVVDDDTGQCSLSVVDTGIGIPTEDLPKLFQRFFRSSNVRADAIQGTGLGLPIVQSVVEAHHGSIEVASQPGEGTSFTISLPLA